MWRFPAPGDFWCPWAFCTPGSDAPCRIEVRSIAPQRWWWGPGSVPAVRSIVLLCLASWLPVRLSKAEQCQNRLAHRFVPQRGSQSRDEIEREEGESVVAVTCGVPGTAPYHAELWLELDLQTLNRASQFCDLWFAGLYLLCVAGYFAVQLISLKEKKTTVKSHTYCIQNF